MNKTYATFPSFTGWPYAVRPRPPRSRRANASR